MVKSPVPSIEVAPAMTSAFEIPVVVREGPLVTPMEVLAVTVEAPEIEPALVIPPELLLIDLVTTLPEPFGVKEILPLAPSAIVILPEFVLLFVCNVKSLVPEVVIAAFVFDLPTRTVLEFNKIPGIAVLAEDNKT